MTAAMTLEQVLEAFLLDRDGTTTVQRYVAQYPQFALELLDLEFEAARPLDDEPRMLGANERAVVDGALDKASVIWPAQAPGSRDLFAVLGPADYGRLSKSLNVPRQVIAAIRNRRAIPETIPGGFLRRMADALEGSVADLLASMGAGPTLAAQYKATGAVAVQSPIPFEQILIEAQVPPERRAQIMADLD
ncbi:hypothetical protein NRB_14410 [Novosphingobium sp. 11B]